MTTIQVRKNQIQSLTGNNIYRVDCKLTTDIKSIANVVWSFKCIDKLNTSLFHSTNAEEEVFLNYANEYEPLLQITVPEAGQYNVVVIARIERKQLKDIEITRLDENNNLSTVTESQEVTLFDTFESAPLVITIDNSGWV
jgi:hypothetical protein